MEKEKTHGRHRHHRHHRRHRSQRREKQRLMPYFGRCMRGFVLLQLMISFVFVKMIDFNLIAKTFLSTGHTMMLCAGVYLAFLIPVLVKYMFVVRDFKAYYRVNVTSYLIISVPACILAALDAEPLYTYLFVQYKLFFVMGADKLASAICYSFINLAVICAIPPAIKEKICSKW